MSRFAILGVLLLFVIACGDGSVTVPSASDSPPAAQRVVLIGVDGATWKIIGELIENGEAPAFARLVAEGASMPLFDTMEVTHSPIVWTTVATGRRPRDHGVRHFIETLDDGVVIPVTQNSRKVKALWNLASDAGLTVGVVEWWASWPAEEVNGFVVSNHANPINTRYREEDGRNWTADTAELQSLDRDYYPPDMAAKLAPFWVPEDAFPFEELQRRGKFTDKQIELLRRVGFYSQWPYSVLKRTACRDFPNFKFAKHALTEIPTDLLMVYVRGPDDLQHRAWDLVEPAEYANPSPQIARDRGLIKGLYRYLDSLLGEFLAAKDDDTILILASDHGAEPNERAKNPDYKGQPGGHRPGCHGVLFMHGGPVKAGFAIEDADPYDLMPTIAWLLGLPLSRELPGRVLSEAFEPTFVATQGIEWIEAYPPREARDTGESAVSPQDEAMLEQLRQVGYIR